MGCTILRTYCALAVFLYLSRYVILCRGVGASPFITDFVIRNGSSLQAGGKPFYITGFNNYYLPTYSAWLDGGRRDDVDIVFRDAKKLGLNALRTWAFSDGPAQWNAIQPEWNVLNETILSEGLDYVIAKASSYGIRLILTLQNYWPDYGGAQQWTQWYNGTSIVDYYGNKDTRAGVKTYMGRIVMRNNTITGRLYRDEPAILAWDIMNEPQYPGDDTGKLLTEWIDDMASFLKGIDKNHLVMCATMGYFGASTPDLVSANPTDMVVIHEGDTRLFPVAQICQGEDSSAIAALPHIDFTDLHIYPEIWAFCTTDCNFNLEGLGPYPMTANLSSEGFLELCSHECRLSFMQDWIQLHLQEAARLGKPLIISEFGSWRPMSVRNAVYSTLYNELSKGKDAGLPVAGSLFWMLEAPSHNGSEWDQYAVFTNASMFIHDPKRPQPLPPSTKAQEPDPKFYNEEAYLRCASARIPVQFNAAVDINNDGWQDTLAIIQQQASQLTGSA